jgi:hypothetical protein
MVDLQPTDTVLIDPPMADNDAPLMGNPVLARRSTPRRGTGAANLGWYVGIPLAVAAVCGVAYFAVSAHQSAPLTTEGPVAPQAQQASIAPAPLPSALPKATPAPAVRMAQATPEPAMAPVAPETGAMHHHIVRRESPAVSATDSGADVSATAPEALPAAPAPAVAQPGPPVIAPAPAPQSAPVITPPPQ